MTGIEKKSKVTLPSQGDQGKPSLWWGMQCIQETKRSTTRRSCRGEGKNGRR